MKKRRTEKEFDCVEMKRRIQEQIAAETEGMTAEQRLAYLRELVNKSRFAALLKQIPVQDKAIAQPQ